MIHQINLYMFRIETPGPSSSGFKDRFQRIGDDVWEEWDKYLAETWNGELAMSGKSFVTYLNGHRSK